MCMFGKTVERFDQDEKQVVAHFSDGTINTYNLLVGADGQGSRIRKAILPADAPDPCWRLGLYIAYYFIPRITTDNNIRRSYHSPGGRLIMRRSHNPTESQLYLALRGDSEELRAIPKATIEQQKTFRTQRFRDAGWQMDRFHEGMKITENFYCEEVLQVRTNTWYKRRVVLLGDAAHCASPISGMGTTGSFVGAYVLAGEINRSSEDLPKAFKKYDETLRPFVNEIQKINPWFLTFFIPKTKWGIAILYFVVGLMCFLRIPKLITMFSSAEKEGWKLPNYEDVNME